MIKILSIAISAMVVLLVSLFGDPESKIAVTSSVSPHLVPGEDCVVKLTVSKGGTAGYATLQQVLPLGLTATPVETMGAKFEMEENVVKFVWTDMPAEGSFTVSYIMQTDPNESEIKSVAGTFVYMEKNEPVKVDLAPLQLNFSNSAASASKSEVDRKIIAVTPESGEYKVELTIHPKRGEHAARYTDNIPQGYTVNTVNASGGKFLFSNQQASFEWSQLPEVSSFTISYHLKATGDQIESPKVTGMLVYGIEPASQRSADAGTATLTAGTTDEIHAADIIASNLAAQEQQTASVPLSVSYAPSAQKGIFFKIQIAATRKSPLRNDKFFQEKYHFGQHVDLTEQDGWRKYMIGNFDSFSSANNFIQRTKEKIPDAFVVAYKNAVRITLEEALTETSKAD